MLRTHAFRLTRGQDLKKELLAYCQKRAISAAVPISGVGSLQVAQLRFADAKQPALLQGPFEIVSLTGTMSQEGLHLHIAIADHEGRTLGGHLMEGCLIHTTAEIVLLEDSNWKFERTFDAGTGYKELAIRRSDEKFD